MVFVLILPKTDDNPRGVAIDYVYQSFLMALIKTALRFTTKCLFEILKNIV